VHQVAQAGHAFAGQPTEVHQDRTIAIEDDHAQLRTRQRQAETDHEAMSMEFHM
jgi:hypothetical protein